MYLKNKGFTFFEMIVTLVIIAAFSAIFMLNYNREDFEQTKYHAATISALRYAQSKAISTGCPVRVDFNDVAYEYKFTFKERNTDNCTGSYQDMPSPYGDNTFVVEAPSVATVSSGTTFPFYFNEKGRAVDNSGVVIADVTITIDGGNLSRDITIISETGLIKEEKVSA